MSADVTAAGRLELAADGLSFPTSLAFDPTGVAHVAEAGLPFEGAPAGGRVWRLERHGNRRLLADRLASPVNGLTFYDGELYVSEAGPPGRISRLELDGRRVVIVGDLPGPGNYHTNMVAFGPAGRLYFSQGAMTNTGINSSPSGPLERSSHVAPETSGADASDRSG